MNYTEYNNQLKLPDDLYKKTLAGVKSEIPKHNQIQRKKKVAYLSFAACFMILVTSISTVKYLNNNSSDTFVRNAFNQYYLCGCFQKDIYMDIPPESLFEREQ